MRAMVLDKQGEKLTLKQVPMPTLSGTQDVLIQVSMCGICRTDLHVVDGDLKFPRLPLIPGHQIVGYVKECLSSCRFKIGDRIGVPWLGGSCGQCNYCLNNEENLCDNAKYTGYQLNGGFAEYCSADSRFCFSVPEGYPDSQAAPLFCAGLIGYRAMNKIRQAKKIGFYGFGASAHILTQLAVSQGKQIYAFTRAGDSKTQAFAKSLGAVWAGSVDEPSSLDAAIIFAPSGDLIPLALKNVKKGGTVVCAGIHMSDIPSFPYEILWGERHICSVANLTRFDGEAFLNLAPLVPIRTTVHVYSLDKTNEALEDLRQGRIEGAAVIQI
ncbi:MAG: alcohol dehydrogenase [Gammaproteobacteria bacterium 39-13]|nr:zinc-dependent alcohol dehydrogenase family protein [Gammaproteobacteria bacterium]OJV94314.1 MAG: alcohol dehydrogenase [Gammaproteobacteria bacterium 39-13]